MPPPSRQQNRTPVPILPPPPATLTIKDLRLSVPMLAIALLVGAAVLLIRYPEQPQLRAEHRQQEVAPAWAVDVHPALLASIGAVVAGALPAPLEGQQRPPCDPDLQRELRGACWVPVDVPRCPKGKAFVNDEGSQADGKCYARAMRAAGAPTSGEPRQAAVADPP